MKTLEGRKLTGGLSFFCLKNKHALLRPPHSSARAPKITFSCTLIFCFVFGKKSNMVLISFLCWELWLLFINLISPKKTIVSDLSEVPSTTFPVSWMLHWSEWKGFVQKIATTMMIMMSRSCQRLWVAVDFSQCQHNWAGCRLAHGCRRLFRG